MIITTTLPFNNMFNNYRAAVEAFKYGCTITYCEIKLFPIAKVWKCARCLSRVLQHACQYTLPSIVKDDMKINIREGSGCSYDTQL